MDLGAGRLWASVCQAWQEPKTPRLPRWESGGRRTPQRFDAVFAAQPPQRRWNLTTEGLLARDPRAHPETSPARQDPRVQAQANGAPNQSPANPSQADKTARPRQEGPPQTQGTTGQADPGHAGAEASNMAPRAKHFPAPGQTPHRVQASGGARSSSGARPRDRGRKPAVAGVRDAHPEDRIHVRAARDGVASRPCDPAVCGAHSPRRSPGAPARCRAPRAGRRR